MPKVTMANTKAEILAAYEELAANEPTAHEPGDRSRPDPAGGDDPVRSDSLDDYGHHIRGLRRRLGNISATKSPGQDLRERAAEVEQAVADFRALPEFVREHG